MRAFASARVCQLIMVCAEIDKTSRAVNECRPSRGVVLPIRTIGLEKISPFYSRDEFLRRTAIVCVVGIGTAIIATIALW